MHILHRHYSSSSINLAAKRHQYSQWVRATRSSPKRRDTRPLARASTRTRQVSTLLEVDPLPCLLKLLMMKEFVNLNGPTTSDNYVNTRYNSATLATCHSSILPTPSLAHMIVISALDTGNTQRKKQSQLMGQLSTFEHSIVFDSIETRRNERSAICKICMM